MLVALCRCGGASRVSLVRAFFFNRDPDAVYKKTHHLRSWFNVSVVYIKKKTLYSSHVLTLHMNIDPYSGSKKV